LQLIKVETAADLLTWKNAQLEENTVLEFTQQYEKLTDEEKADLIGTAKSAHKEYVQKMIKKVKERKKRRIDIELEGGEPSEAEVKEKDIQDVMGF
jgi:hypothetical protein